MPHCSTCTIFQEFPCETSVSPTSQEKNEAMKVVGEFLKKMEIDHDGHSVSALILEVYNVFKLSTIPEDRETIASLSPQKELEQRPMDIDVNNGETANQPDAILVSLGIPLKSSNFSKDLEI